MTLPKPTLNYFILEAFDREWWCPIMQARFEVAELEELRAVLGAQADDDPDLRHGYTLDRAELKAVVDAFGIGFDPRALWPMEPEITLYRMHSIRTVPYLVHTGYELPLLLDGRKKLARMGDAYPPMVFDGEDRFEYWVNKGKLHREEVFEPFDPPHRIYKGHRRVYYTIESEEWRIPAMKLIWQAAAKAGGWNEYFERLEGMLFGYEDWQNDWWINIGLTGGGIGGTRLCCAVTLAGLAWIEAAGYRALPPISKPTIAVIPHNAMAEAEMHAFMLEDPESEALVCFNIFGGIIAGLADAEGPPPWRVQDSRIPELNRHLRRPVTVVMRRESLSNDE